MGLTPDVAVDVPAGTPAGTDPALDRALEVLGGGRPTRLLGAACGAPAAGRARTGPVLRSRRRLRVRFAANERR